MGAIERGCLVLGGGKSGGDYNEIGEMAGNKWRKVVLRGRGVARRDYARSHTSTKRVDVTEQIK